MKLIDIENNDIRDFSSESIFERAYEYYENQYVKELKYDLLDDNISSYVQGSKLYECEISIENNRISAYCNCPYEGYPCKHIIATLLCFVNNKNKYLEIAKKETKEFSKLVDLIKDLSKDKLIEIVLKALKNDNDLKNEIMLQLEPNKKSTIINLIRQIDKIFNYIDSSIYEDLSALWAKLGSIINSVSSSSDIVYINVCWQFVNRLLSMMNEYGMSDEYLEDWLIEVLDNVIEKINNKINENSSEKDELIEKKKEIISELIKNYNTGNCGLLDYIYGSALSLCKEKEDYQIIINKLNKSSSYEKTLLVNLYKKMNDEESQRKILEENLYYGMDYWELANFWIEKGEDERALGIIKEGIEKGEGRKDELIQYLNDYYKKIDDYESIYQLLLKTLGDEKDHFRFNIKSNILYQTLKEHYITKESYENLLKIFELRLLDMKNIDFDFYLEIENKLHEKDKMIFHNKIIKNLKKTLNEKDTYSMYENPIKEPARIFLSKIYSHKNDIINLVDIIKNDLNLLNEYREKINYKDYKKMVFELIKNNIYKLYKYENLFLDEKHKYYITQYKKIVISLIERKNRNSYKESINYLERIKKIYEEYYPKINEYEDFIKHIKEKYRRYRALLEELKNSGF